ncbi:hypothetical protein RSJ42_08835 [Methanosarcina hadiensis]|uniref:hypothetical protein n=1 Tax=Methanosarcina hadiensis TaxID=3078083 RepID=UPI003977BD6C
MSKVNRIIDKEDLDESLIDKNKKIVTIGLLGTLIFSSIFCVFHVIFITHYLPENILFIYGTFYILCAFVITIFFSLTIKNIF